MFLFRSANFLPQFLLNSPATNARLKALLNQTMPMLIGLLAIMGNQLIDNAFIGQLGEQPLAIVGYSLPIYQLIIGLQVGVGIATTACASAALGAGKTRLRSAVGSHCVGYWWRPRHHCLSAAMALPNSDCEYIGSRALALCTTAQLLATMVNQLLAWRTTAFWLLHLPRFRTNTDPRKSDGTVQRN